MNRDQLVRAAIAGAIFAGATVGSTAYAADMKDMEKCWGAAKAGQNDCGSNKTSHSCAGQSKKDFDVNDFKAVKAGTCVQMGGSLTQGKAGKMAMEKKG
jgi:uncharacterized membrane protein